MAQGIRWEPILVVQEVCTACCRARQLRSRYPNPIAHVMNGNQITSQLQKRTLAGERQTGAGVPADRRRRRLVVALPCEWMRMDRAVGGKRNGEESIVAHSVLTT